jgi:hypothetical protein
MLFAMSLTSCLLHKNMLSVNLLGKVSDLLLYVKFLFDV